MLRIALFLLTNLAIVLVASITLSLLGFEGYLASNGVDLNLSSLLVFCFIFGMAGSVVSLLLSKTMAKMGTGTQIIESPRNADEQWLVATVAESITVVMSFRCQPATCLNPTSDESAIVLAWPLAGSTWQGEATIPNQPLIANTRRTRNGSHTPRTHANTNDTAN